MHVHAQGPYPEELSGAVYSECQRYRYLLWRVWDSSRRPLTAILLNPSNADTEPHDETIERVQYQAAAMGAGGVRIANLFALRAPNPDALYAAKDPSGPDNDVVLVEACFDSLAVLCGWGSHGALNDRARAVMRLIEATGARLTCLGVDPDGSPKPPLEVSCVETLRPYKLGLESTNSEGSLGSDSQE